MVVSATSKAVLWISSIKNIAFGLPRSHASRRTDSFLKISLGKLSLKIMRLLDDYTLTSICFWEHWFPLENKLRFLNFPVGAGGVVVQKKPPNFSLLIFHRAPPSRRSTALLALPWKITLYLLIFSLLNFSELILREKNQSGEGRDTHPQGIWSWDSGHAVHPFLHVINSFQRDLSTCWILFNMLYSLSPFNMLCCTLSTCCILEHAGINVRFQHAVWNSTCSLFIFSFQHAV